MDICTNPELLVMFIAIILTPLISWMKVETWTNEAKQSFALVVAAIAGVATVTLCPGTQVDPARLVEAALLAAGTNQVAFKTLMKGLGVENLFDKLKGVEKKQANG